MKFLLLDWFSLRLPFIQGGLQGCSYWLPLEHLLHTNSIHRQELALPNFRITRRDFLPHLLTPVAPEDLRASLPTTHLGKDLLLQKGKADPVLKG